MYNVHAASEQHYRRGEHDFLRLQNSPGQHNSIIQENYKKYITNCKDNLYFNTRVMSLVHYLRKKYL